MKIRVTLMTENDKPVSALGTDPEEKVRKAWNIMLNLISLQGEDSAYVENVEIISENNDEMARKTDNLISRQWLLDKMKQNRKKFCNNEIEFKALSTIDKTRVKTRVDEIDNCIWEIINAPTEQKTGKWQKYEGRFDYDWECSECGCSAWEKTDYCAHCGARMVGEGDECKNDFDMAHTS